MNYAKLSTLLRILMILYMRLAVVFFGVFLAVYGLETITAPAQSQTEVTSGIVLLLIGALLIVKYMIPDPRVFGPVPTSLRHLDRS